MPPALNVAYGRAQPHVHRSLPRANADLPPAPTPTPAPRLPLEGITNTSRVATAAHVASEADLTILVLGDSSTIMATGGVRALTCALEYGWQHFPFTYVFVVCIMQSSVKPLFLFQVHHMLLSPTIDSLAT